MESQWENVPKYLNCSRKVKEKALCEAMSTDHLRPYVPVLAQHGKQQMGIKHVHSGQGRERVDVLVSTPQSSHHQLFYPTYTHGKEIQMRL